MSHQQLAAPVNTVEVGEIARDVIFTDIRTRLAVSFIVENVSMFCRDCVSALFDYGFTFESIVKDCVVVVAHSDTVS